MLHLSLYSNALLLDNSCKSEAPQVCNSSAKIRKLFTKLPCQRHVHSTTNTRFLVGFKKLFFQLKKAFEQVVKKLLKIVQKRSQKTMHFPFSYKNFEFKIIRF